MYGDTSEGKTNAYTNEDPQAWLATIEDLVDSGEYDWAEDTLLGIGETIEKTQRVTIRQIEAISNIQNATSFKRR